METLPMGALTEHRIRQLAIAIQQMDSEDADRLLEHFPAPLAKRIRNQFGLLGHITQDERRLAIETVEELLESDESSTSRGAQQQNPIAPSRDDFTIEDYPIEAIVSVLSQERPIVIATVLRNLPSRLGQSIVPRLDLELAKESLDWIPRLEVTHERVLDEVLSEFYNQVHSVGSRLESLHQGQEKLQDLLLVLHESKQTYAPVALQPSTDAHLDFNAEPTSPFVIPLNRKTSREEALDVLLKLDDLDLLRVLYSHNAQDVKRFLAGANKAMRMRIEKLTPRQSVKKLRRELASVPIIDEKTWKELAGQFVQTAIELSQTESTQEDLRIPA